jgi:hypothetical protein
MSDLFHKDLADDYICRVADVMLEANWHTYQVLTKRSERMRDLLNSKLASAAMASHIWWGVSVEDRKYGVPRIVHLQAAKVELGLVCEFAYTVTSSRAEDAPNLVEQFQPGQNNCRVLKDEVNMQWLPSITHASVGGTSLGCAFQ